MLTAVGAVATLAVVADAITDAVSMVAAERIGRVVRCHPAGEQIAPRARQATIALNDGQIVTVRRFLSGRPICGSIARVTTLVTPWGTSYRRIGNPRDGDSRVGPLLP